MATEPAEQTPCACNADGCTCDNDADFTTKSGIAMCGCCAADCPDTHGPDGLTWSTGYHVRTVPWSGGWELHVDDVGVTQCADISDAEATVRSLLDTLDYPDAHTANVTVWRVRA